MTTTIRGNHTVYYYRDLAAARAFYVDSLGFAPVAATDHSHTLRVTGSSYLTLADKAYGPFRGDEPKTVTTALITDELEAWYVYLTALNVPMERPFAPKAGSAHDGFVILDPEGYFLEFERFNRHGENTDLLPILDTLAPRYPKAGAVPAELGIKATVTWFYYEDLRAGCRFLEDVWGFSQLVDQGFAAIYRTSESGFWGPVQAGDGLHPFTPEKLVTPALFTADLPAWRDRFHTAAAPSPDDTSAQTGRDFDSIGITDPAGYRLELHQIRTTAATVRLDRALQETGDLYVNS